MVACCFVRMDDHRDRNAFVALTGALTGYLITDDYALYRSWPAEMRQSCPDHHTSIALMGNIYKFSCSYLQIEIKALHLFQF